MKLDGYKQLLDYSNEFVFDLIIHDYTFGPCLLGFSEKFNQPPIVRVTAYNIPAFTSEFIGGHQFYAYAPHIYLNHENEKLSFLERAKNLIIYTIENM